MEEKVLDKGFVRLIDFMGGDAGVVLGARVSYAQGLKGDEKDRKLVSYLLRHSHMTPFEQAVFKFHVKMPIFVMRQLVRHRFASINEESARYREMTEDFYVPAAFRGQDVKNKQGSLKTPDLNQGRLAAKYEETTRQTYAAYKELINTGVAREMARMVLPVSLYTQIYWTINARSLMNFILLRAESHAQWEIQQYAMACAKFFKAKMPWTWEAFLRFGWKGGHPVLDQEKAGLENLDVKG
ncbi:MAG: FAD-dependent thymidylate synthase [Elusimicrobia bacterium]|nr:FAD-dependent thymidylate synthase [Elusimicrobiota bacterium]